MTTERRFAEFRRDDDGGGLNGTLLRYGDTAKVFERYTETIEPGAFGVINPSVFRLNLMHERSQPIAFADSEFLSLSNSDKSLDLSLRYPDHIHGRNAKELVETGTLRGLSVEFQVEKNGHEWDGDNVRIKAAKLLGAGIVDIPAYPDSRIHRFNIPIPPERSGVESMLEFRAGGKLAGEMKWNSTSITSVQRRLAVRFLPGALDITTMPIVLLHGSFQSPLAATGADSLKLKVGAAGLSWVASKIAKTQASKDVRALMRAKLISGWTAGYVADPENVIQREIEIGGLKFKENIVEKALLCDIKLISAGSGGQGKVKRRQVDWFI